MSYLYQSVKGYIFKAPLEQPKEVEDDKQKKQEGEDEDEEIEEIEEITGPSDKKTDEIAEAPQGNIVWRMTSGVYGTATSAVGMGVGGVKWVAGKSYDVGSAVVSNVKVPKLSSLRRKDKKE